MFSPRKQPLCRHSPSKRGEHRTLLPPSAHASRWLRVSCRAARSLSQALRRSPVQRRSCSRSCFANFWGSFCRRCLHGAVAGRWSTAVAGVRGVSRAHQCSLFCSLDFSSLASREHPNPRSMKSGSSQRTRAPAAGHPAAVGWPSPALLGGRHRPPPLPALAKALPGGAFIRG